MASNAPSTVVRTRYTGDGTSVTVGDANGDATVGTGWRFPTFSDGSIDPPDTATDPDAFLLPFVPDTDSMWDTPNVVSVPVDSETPVVVPGPFEGDDAAPGSPAEWLRPRDGGEPTVETLAGGDQMAVGPDSATELTVTSLGEGSRIAGCFRSRPMLVSGSDAGVLAAGPGGCPSSTSDAAAERGGAALAVVDNYGDHDFDFPVEAVHVGANDAPDTEDSPTGYRATQGFDPDLKNAAAAAADCGIDAVTAGSFAGNTAHELTDSGVRGFTEHRQSARDLLDLTAALRADPHAHDDDFPAAAHDLRLAASDTETPLTGETTFDEIRRATGLRIELAGVEPPSVENRAYDTSSLPRRIVAELRSEIDGSDGPDVAWRDERRSPNRRA